MADILPGMIGEDVDEDDAPDAKFRYGEIEFEETGSRVPYLIIPNTDEGKQPKKIVEYMRTHLKFQGKELSKPNIAFRVRARGKSYMEWAVDMCASASPPPGQFSTACAGPQLPAPLPANRLLSSQTYTNDPCGLSASTHADETVCARRSSDLKR